MAEVDRMSECWRMDPGHALTGLSVDHHAS
jgi:hypothetical protein